MRARRLDIWTKKAPGLLGPLVAPVDAHVAAPDDERPALEEDRDKPRRLGVMHDHDVLRSDAREYGPRVPRERLLVVAALRLAEAPSVALRPVQPVVDALRDREEGRIGFDDVPLGRDPCAACVSE
jgi:hypothetical protein